MNKVPRHLFIEKEGKITPLCNYMRTKLTVQEYINMPGCMFVGQKGFTQFINMNMVNYFDFSSRLIQALISLKKINNDPLSIRKMLEETELYNHLTPNQTDLLCCELYQDNPGNAGEQPGTSNG